MLRLFLPFSLNLDYTHERIYTYIYTPTLEIDKIMESVDKNYRMEF